MTSLEDFYQKYPQQTTGLSTGKLFTYRYYKNPKSKATIVLLTGGLAYPIYFIYILKGLRKSFQ